MEPSQLPGADHLGEVAVAVEVPRAGRPPPPSHGPLRTKLIGAILIAAIGLGASIMSCVGQSFSLRQARAMEGIEQQLTLIQQQRCTAVTREGSR